MIGFMLVNNQFYMRMFIVQGEKKQIISQPRMVQKPYSLAQILFTLDTKGGLQTSQELRMLSRSLSVY